MPGKAASRAKKPSIFHFPRVINPATLHFKYELQPNLNRRFARSSSMKTSPSRHDEFVNFLAQHRGQLFGYIFSIAQDFEDTRDIFQEASLVLWQKFDSFDGANFGGWACRVAQYVSFNFLRNKRRGVPCLSNEVLAELAEISGEATYVISDRQAALDRCVDKLSKPDRELLDRCYSPNASISLAAEQSRRSVQSVCNSLRRIRQTLLNCVNRTLAQGVRL